MFTIISVANDKYYRYLTALVKSAAIHFPEAAMYVCLVNREENGLKRLHHNIEIEKRYVKGNDKVYCANLRASLFRSVRKRKSGYLIWVDADTVIRGNCKGLIKHIESCDITARPKPVPQHAKRFGHHWSGIISVADTKSCKDFMTAYYHLVSRDPTWLSDQLNLDLALKAFSGNFKPLPEKYMDFEYEPESVIWTGKGKRTKDKRFQEEVGLYA